MGSAFIRRLLNALFIRKKENNAVSRAKDRAANSDKAGNKKAKTANARSKTNLKEKLKPGTEAETEERIRSCAVEIKNCIDMINKSGGGTPGKSKGRRGRANLDNRKADKSAGNRKTSGSRNSDKGKKRKKQGVSPAEMVILLTKAEEKLSKAVVKAKQKVDKKKKGRRKKLI